MNNHASWFGNEVFNSNRFMVTEWAHMQNNPSGNKALSGREGSQIQWAFIRIPRASMVKDSLGHSKIVLDLDLGWEVFRDFLRKRG
jgi:hypothetical protein